MTHTCKTRAEAEAITEGRAPIVVPVEQRLRTIPDATHRRVWAETIANGSGWFDASWVRKDLESRQPDTYWWAVPPFPPGSVVEIGYPKPTPALPGKRPEYIMLGTVTAGEAEVKRAIDVGVGTLRKWMVPEQLDRIPMPDTYLWIINTAEAEKG